MTAVRWAIVAIVGALAVFGGAALGMLGCNPELRLHVREVMSR